MMGRSMVVGAAALALGACTSLPDRMQTSDSPVDGCGYRVEAMTDQGFALEVAYVHYSFFPNPDAAIEGGRGCFVKTAELLAGRRGRALVPITVADMSASASRNVIDGRYSVRVTGKVALRP